MSQTPTTYILCVIANDAAPGDESRPKYTDVGPNFKRRMDEAIAWAQEHLPTQKIIWAFGAGTDDAHALGPTLASLGEAYLRQCIPDAVTVTNRSFKKYYGTLEEIYYIVTKVHQTGRGKDRKVFVFFTQKRHMPRVKRIVEKRHPQVKAKFHVTGQVSEIAWKDVLKSFVKLRMIERGWVQPRYKVGLK